MVKIYDIHENVLIEVDVDDTSSSYRSIDGRHELTLKYSLDAPFELPIGAWCSFQNERFELMSHLDVRMVHTRHYEYTLVMRGSFGMLSRFIVMEPVDGRLQFDMVAKPREFVEMIVTNLNGRDGGWSVGDCIETDEKLISFSHTDCASALSSVADTFGTEYEVVDKVISLKKVEYNKDYPLDLAYGKGNGFKSGVGRTNYEDGLPTKRMFVQGTTRNISYKDYGAMELHLPKSYWFKFDGEKFEGEEGYDALKAKSFVTDSNGYSVSLDSDKIGREESIDLTEIYPKRIGSVSEVRYHYNGSEYTMPFASWTDADWDKVQIDIIDSSIPDDLDYSNCLMENSEPLTVAFQSGELAGRDFDATFIKSGNRFELVKQEYSGQPMPQESFLPKKGDTYVVFNVSLPSSYIADYPTHSGAEFDALREATRALYEKSESRFTFSGELDDIWAKKNWTSIGGKIRIGGYVRFTNSEVTNGEQALVRVVGITQNVNNPHCPKIELSNVAHKGSVSSRISQIEDKDAHVNELYRESKRYAKRTFKGVKETLEMLEGAFEGFSNGINPVTVQTMAMLVGDQSLQFRFTNSRSSLTAVNCPLTYNPTSKRMDAVARSLIHLTLGIDEITPSDTRVASDYKSWNMPSWSSSILDDSSKKYYVYAVVPRNSTSGSYTLSETPVGMTSVSNYYYFLVGILNAEYEGSREFVTLYGFTEILPAQITTDVLKSANGKLVIDLLNAVIEAKNGATIKGSVVIESGSSGLGNLSEWSGQSQRIDSAYNTAISAGNTAGTALTNASTALQNANTANSAANAAGVTAQQALENANKANAAAEQAIQDAEHAKDFADAAGSIASKATATLAEWASDGVISPVEKNGLQSELAFIVGDYGDVSKCYTAYIEDFDTSILTDGKYEVAEGQYFVLATAKTNWQSYVNAYNAYKADLESKIGTEGSVAIGNLASLQTAFYSARIAILESFALATKAEADYAKKKAEKAAEDLEYFKSDYQQLRDTFGKPVLGVDGVMMSRMVAVANAINDVEAFLNGSDFANDSSHGKMLLAAGIPDKVTVNGTDTRDLLTRAKEALTKIFEDGYIVSKNMHLLEGATIGNNVEVTADGIQVNAMNGGQTSLNYRDGLSAKSGKNVRVIMGNNAGQAVQVTSENGMETGSSIFEPIGYYASMGEDESAYYCQRGVFSGLRPKCRSVSGTVYLTALDHTIFAGNSSTTIKLPGEPYNGQEYVILVPNGGVQIEGNGKSIFLFHDGATRTGFKCGDLATRVEVRLYWNKDDNKWWVTHTEN